MQLSKLAGTVAESATLRINERAARLRAEGKPVVHLGIGEPQNPAPATAVQAVQAALERGRLKYTAAAGLPSLRAAIARRSAEDYGLAIAERNVLVSNGSKHALFNLLLAILDPGDEVAFPIPYWVSYPEMVKLARGVPAPVAPAGGTQQPDPQALLAALGDRTRAVILNSPNNPSGLVYSEELVGELVRACERRGVYLIMDDIYRQLTFGGVAPPSAFRFSAAEIDSTHVIAINGVSKLYGMTGARLGWAIGPAGLIEAMATIQGQTTSNASVLSQAAAEGALTGDQSDVGELVEHLRRNRETMLAGLEELPGVRTEAPDGGLYCFPDLSEIEPDSLRLSELLLEKALVVTVPGIEFGMEGHLRLGFAGEPEDVVEGMRRIAWALDPGRPAEITIAGERVRRNWG